MTHHTQQMIADAASEGRGYVVVRLADGDTAWDRPTDITGPGMVTYRSDERGLWVCAFDPLAGDHDPRCTTTRGNGDVCRLVAGKHLAHFFGEPDAPDTPWVGTGRDGNDPPPGFMPPTSATCGWCGRRVRDTAELHTHPCTPRI